MLFKLVLTLKKSSQCFFQYTQSTSVASQSVSILPVLIKFNKDIKYKYIKCKN